MSDKETECLTTYRTWTHVESFTVPSDGLISTFDSTDLHFWFDAKKNKANDNDELDVFDKRETVRKKRRGLNHMIEWKDILFSFLKQLQGYGILMEGL